MKLTPRIWILAVAVIISIISIMPGDAYARLGVLLLLLGIMLVPKFVKSKPGRILVVFIFIITSIFLIYSSLDAGVVIKSVEQNSTAFEQGLRQGAIIKSINGQPIGTLQDYTRLMGEIFPSEERVRVDIATDRGEYILFIQEPPQIVAADVPKSRIKTGLDISGGARALVQPEQEITDEQLQELIDVSRNRFNVFGISDVNIIGVTDLSGGKFMLVEVAGATPSDLEDLLARQGKFEAKIGNQTAFEGGERDITNVCRNDATCAAVTGCFPGGEGYICNFAFTIYLSEDAARRHADITREIPLDTSSGGQYLSQNLTLLLDDEEVDTLRISSGLKGQVTTQISIQGSGQGATQQAAFQDARDSMHHLQTILLTGSLPFSLEIVKLDTISPVLGNQFVQLILLAGVSAIVAVALFIFVRYRDVKASTALLLTSFSELLIILGIASIINWNLDLPSIAGILAVIGTGVDQQIVILDEAKSGRQVNLRERMKRAMFVVMAAYFTALVAMIPLYWAGAGLFKGFAITTIIGITAGVFITRPAFSDIIRQSEE